MNDKCANR